MLALADKTNTQTNQTDRSRLSLPTLNQQVLIIGLYGLGAYALYSGGSEIVELQLDEGFVDRVPCLGRFYALHQVEIKLLNNRRPLSRTAHILCKGTFDTD